MSPTGRHLGTGAGRAGPFRMLPRLVARSPRRQGPRVCGLLRRRRRHRGRTMRNIRRKRAAPRFTRHARSGPAAGAGPDGRRHVRGRGPGSKLQTTGHCHHRQGGEAGPWQDDALPRAVPRIVRRREALRRREASTTRYASLRRAPRGALLRLTRARSGAPPSATTVRPALFSRMGWTVRPSGCRRRPVSPSAT